jgi:hypothetical protein
MPISLSDSELDVVMAAAKPLMPSDRDAFLRDVAVELARYPELGPGIVGRVVGKIQRQHLAPRSLALLLPVLRLAGSCLRVATEGTGRISRPTTCRST